MAVKQRVITEATDDLDGTPFDPDQGEGVVNFPFSVGGTNYLIDLCAKNEAQFRGLLDRYTEVARPAPLNQGQYAQAVKLWAARVREWARAHHHEVADAGQIPADLEQKYVKANPEDPKPVKAAPLTAGKV